MSANEDIYGNGIELADDFDFVIDASGDIASAQGDNELQKDIAFRVKRFIDLSDYDLLETTGKEELLLDVETIVESDERVQSTTASIVEREGIGDIAVEVSADAIDELVTNVIQL